MYVTRGFLHDPFYGYSEEHGWHYTTLFNSCLYPSFEYFRNILWHYCSINIILISWGAHIIQLQLLPSLLIEFKCYVLILVIIHEILFKVTRLTFKKITFMSLWWITVSPQMKCYSFIIKYIHLCDYSYLLIQPCLYLLIHKKPLCDPLMWESTKIYASPEDRSKTVKICLPSFHPGFRWIMSVMPKHSLTYQIYFFNTADDQGFNAFHNDWPFQGRNHFFHFPFSKSICVYGSIKTIKSLCYINSLRVIYSLNLNSSWISNFPLNLTDIDVFLHSFWWLTDLCVLHHWFPGDCIFGIA